MSLDLSLVQDEETVWSTNITHNLNGMFEEAGVYELLWHGNDLIAGEQIVVLERAYARMTAEPALFKAHNAPNGWGTYEHALPWLASVIENCKLYPQAKIRCWI